MIRSLVSVPVPTTAAIDGPAIGLGMDLALACDVRIVGSNGWLMQGWARVGLVPATGGVMLLASRAPTLLWRMLADQPRLDGHAASQEGIAEKAEDALRAAIERATSLGQMSRPMLAAYEKECCEPLRRWTRRQAATGAPRPQESRRSCCLTTATISLYDAEPGGHKTGLLIDTPGPRIR
jgi:enoyl-CoA hydratase/carnithine racemase